MDEWVESEHPRDEEGKFTDKNGSSSGGLLDGVDFYDIEAAKDYINIPNRFKEDAEGWDNQKSVKKIARILENPVMSEMWNRVESLDKEKEKKKEIIDHISRNEYIATPETLMFYLYDGFDGQTTVKDFMKKYNVYDETYIKQMLAGLSVNYPEFINFSDTLGLDTINLNKSKSEKSDYYTIKIVDENGDLYDEKTVLASKSLIKKIYGNKVSSIQKETKKMRIDGAESLFESEAQQAQDIAMDEKDSSIWSKVKEITFDWIDKHKRIHNDETNRFERKTLEFLGEEFVGYKGVDAVNKLMEEKRGYIKDAFFRKDIGGITLCWGNEKEGLCHIVHRRQKHKENTRSVLQKLTETIEKGVLTEIERNKLIYEYNHKKVIIGTVKNGDKLNFVVSSYEINERKR